MPKRKVRRVVVLLNGNPGAGKDTFAANVISEMGLRGWCGVNLSCVDFIKEWLVSLDVDLDTKTPDLRKLIASIKDELDQFDHVAMKVALQRIDDWTRGKGERSSICFMRVREPASMKFLEDALPSEWQVLKVLVIRNEAPPVTTNVGDASVQHMLPDLTITNNGTLSDFGEACAKFAQSLLNEEIKI